MTEPVEEIDASTRMAGYVFVAAAGLFAVIAHRVGTRQTESVDQTVRGHMQELRRPAIDIAVKPVTLLSLPILVVTATAGLALWLRNSGRRDAALAVAITPIMAATAGQSFTTFLAQRNPPDKGDSPNGEVTEPSFPSGHTTGVTAEALTIAYVLASEESMSPLVLGALVAWPLLVGVTRVYRDRHWITDVLAGWVAGIGVAALSSMLYSASAREP